MAALFEEFDNVEIPKQGKSNEWYTPARYVEAAREVMGGIDLDPASCEMANRTVKAKRYYTIEDNGLNKEWKAKNVWLNPPYGSTEGDSNIKLFTCRLLDEYKLGNIEQAILLSTAKVCTSWFPPLWNYPICFVDHNILFNVPRHLQKKKYPHMSHIHGTIFVYFGPNESKFIDIFNQFGTIAKAISKPKPIMHTLWEVE